MKSRKKLNKYNNSEAPDHQIEIRVGIHAGDVIEFESNIKGDTVNIAARIQQTAKPGSIFLSRNVYDMVKSKVKLNFHFLGKFKFKNIVEPVKLYKINL
jgi:class 3 adenylate cyclase